MKRKLNRIFSRLYSAFGAQHWWPADSAFEVMVGAILTQNTSWSNVEKAITALKEKKLLNPRKLYQLKLKELAGLIRSAGYYNVKAARLKSFLKFFLDSYAAKINPSTPRAKARGLLRIDTESGVFFPRPKGRGLDAAECIKSMGAQDLMRLRGQLLAVKGIGPETADSILLYALHKPIFVVDAYTKRIFLRHGLIKEETGYAQVQDIFMYNLKKDAKLFNEYHALLVKLAKDYCRKQNPKCEICPLHGQ